MNDLYKKVKKFVEDFFEQNSRQSSRPSSLPHLERTVYWLKELKPDADEVLLSAAIAHDIERAFQITAMVEVKEKRDGFLDEIFLKTHAEQGAEIMGKFLKQEGFDDEVTARVKKLITHHEIGGDDEDNLLRDADSISFFEKNVDGFMDRYLPKVGLDKVKQKIDWMFERIGSAKAKEITRPMYETALKKLSEIK